MQWQTCHSFQLLVPQGAIGTLLQASQQSRIGSCAYHILRIAKWFAGSVLKLLTRSFAIVISSYSAVMDKTHMNAGHQNVELGTRSQAESQGAGPCTICGLSICCPTEPRSRTSCEGHQRLNHSFTWNSRCLAQCYPECDRDNLIGDVCLRLLRCFARVLE